jgi:hypothetical protein
LTEPKKFYYRVFLTSDQFLSDEEITEIFASQSLQCELAQKLGNFRIVECINLEGLSSQLRLKEKDNG